MRYNNNNIKYNNNIIPFGETNMVSVTVSIDDMTYERLRAYCDSQEIKLSHGAAKLIRLGYARSMELSGSKIE
jgi:hypothetical protein